MAAWNMNCVHAPKDEMALHCRKENEGKIAARKTDSRDRVVRKGFFGCARHCRFFESKNRGK